MQPGPVDASAWNCDARRGQFYNFSVGTTPSVILSGNPYTRSLVLSCPGTSALGGGSAPIVNLLTIQEVFSSSPQQLNSYTVPVGTAALLNAWWGRTVSGNTPNMQPMFTRGAVTFNITSAITQNVIQPGNIWFNPGDVVFMNVSGTTGGTIQTWMNWVLYNAGVSSPANQVFVGFGQSITASTGFPIYGGMNPQVLDYEQFGTMVQLDLWAVAAAPATPFNVLVGYE